MFINNLGSMIRALGGEESDRHSLVILFSLCNATSRYVIGLVADKLYDALLDSDDDGGKSLSSLIVPHGYLVPFGLRYVLLVSHSLLSSALCLMCVLSQASVWLMFCCHFTLFIAPTLRTVKFLGPVLALAFGGVFSMVPSLVSLLYGMPHFGQNWVRLMSKWPAPSHAEL